MTEKKQTLLRLASATGDQICYVTGKFIPERSLIAMDHSWEIDPLTMR